MNEYASKEVAFWCKQIDIYEREFRKWTDRSKKIIKRYKDDRGDGKRKAQFNILWSNIQTLKPALYASPPKPNIDRRFQDNDDLGRICSQVLERSVSYFINTDDFNDCMEQTVLDRLLPGRGTVWVRYVPNFVDAQIEGSEEVKQEGSQVTEDIIQGDEGVPEVTSEDVVADYVHWEDFGHTWGRTWQEVRAVWRKVYLSRTELEARFPDVGDKIPLEYDSMNKENSSHDENKACVYEIWDKVTKKAYWIHKNMPDVLDERDDPLRLMNFFPCPKPIYATLANDSLVPTPDFLQYQDQALELDNLTGRIESITKSLKVAGVYDGSAEGVQRLLQENIQNKLIPVENWAVLSEKGGLKNVMQFLPLQEIVQTLISLYEAREKVKQDLYEITGMADIVRGASNPNETATAQKIKGQYATLRLDDMQKDVARFGRDIVRLETEIIAEHFSLDTIKKVSGVKLLTEEEKAKYSQALQNPQMAQQVPEEIQDLLRLPTWGQVEQVIRNDMARSFRIDIETDSTIKTDQEAEKASRIEFLSAAGGFIQQAVTIQNPELQPLLMEMLMFGIRGFKVGRDMETNFENALADIKKKSEQAQQNPQPSPEVQAEQMKAQSEQQKLQFEDKKMQSEAELAQAEMAFKMKEMQFKEIELKGKIELERIKLQSAIVQSQPQEEEPDKEDENISLILGELGKLQAQNTQILTEALTRPKTVVRDNQGRIAGVQ